MQPVELHTMRSITIDIARSAVGVFVCLLRQPPAAAMLPIAADIARRTELRSGYMHKKIVKIVLEFPEISSRTHRRTHRNTSQPLPLPRVN